MTVKLTKSEESLILRAYREHEGEIHHSLMTRANGDYSERAWAAREKLIDRGWVEKREIAYEAFGDTHFRRAYILTEAGSAHVREALLPPILEAEKRAAEEAEAEKARQEEMRAARVKQCQQWADACRAWVLNDLEAVLPEGNRVEIKVELNQWDDAHPVEFRVRFFGEDSSWYGWDVEVRCGWDSPYQIHLNPNGEQTVQSTLDLMVRMQIGTLVCERLQVLHERMQADLKSEVA